MATKIYETLDVELMDGTELTLRPLNLKYLRELMKEWAKAESVKNEDEFLQVLVNCTRIAFKQIAPTLLEKENEKSDDKVEEVVDLQTMYKILEVCADIKLNDPNLLAATQGIQDLE